MGFSSLNLCERGSELLPYIKKAHGLVRLNHGPYILVLGMY